MTNMRALRRPDVEKLTGLPRSTIYAKIAAGEFPKPIKLSERSVAWWEREIEAFLQGEWPPSPQEVPKDPEFIGLDIMVHKNTGMLVATSHEMTGLFVHGRTIEQVYARVPEAISALTGDPAGVHKAPPPGESPARCLEEIEAEISQTKAKLSKLWNERREILAPVKSLELERKRASKKEERNLRKQAADRLLNKSIRKYRSGGDLRKVAEDAVDYIIHSGKYRTPSVVKAIKIAAANDFKIELPSVLDLRHFSSKVIEELRQIYAAAGRDVIQKPAPQKSGEGV